MGEITQVHAVGVAVGRGLLPEEIRLRIEAAMTGAIVQAQAEGITDPEIIRARILAARDANRAT